MIQEEAVKVIGLCAAMMVLSGGMLCAAERLDVRDHGAVGDGEALDTVAIQKAIDACTAAGGGEVLLPKGRYLSGSLVLKSGVRLIVSPEAILLGSTRLADYRGGPLLSAKDASDVGIEGGGTIDGQGTAFWEPRGKYGGPPWRGTAQFEYRALRRPSFLRFQRCTNVTVRNVRLTNSPSWTLHLLRCREATVEKVTIRNPLHGPNTDGIDINSCVDVIVRDCDIVTGDDGIVLKSTEPGHDHPSRNITVVGCRVWSACNCFKLGTETHDHFEDITVRDCHFYSDSDNPLERALSGVAIESVDGAHLSRILICDITMSNIRAPLFVRLGHRGGNSERTRQVEPRVPGRIEGVVIRNVRAERAMFESSITGMAGHCVKDVTLENVDLTYEGGGSPGLVTLDVPDEEVVRKYPEAQMFGRLPAYGLYCRHVDGLRLRNVRMGWMKPDARPVLVCDDVRDAVLDAVNVAAPPAGDYPVLWFTGVRDVTVRNCVAPRGTGTFLAVEEAEPDASRLVMDGNDLREAKVPVLRLGLRGLVERGLPMVRERAPGHVVIEAETLQLTPPMCVQEESAVPSGKVIGGPRHGGRDLGTGRCRFEVSVGGEYVIWVRVFAESPEADSFYASIDGGPASLSDVAERGHWSWDIVRNRQDGRSAMDARTVFPLTEGRHSLLIRNRECGTRLDTIVIAPAAHDFDPARDVE